VRMSPTCNSAPACTFSRLPVTSESSTCTSSPRASSVAATCEPMKPAPPVTIARKAPYPRLWMFITFEGLDGSGKSTQTELLAEAIRGTGRDVVTTREPGGTPLGEHVRELLLNGDGISAWAEAALFAAARAELDDGLAHAYLFHGPPGVGKRALATAFAAELLGDARRVERGSHPDLYALEPLGDQIRIDAIRALRHDLHMRPFEADYRVYL